MKAKTPKLGKCIHKNMSTFYEYASQVGHIKIKTDKL